MTKPTALALTLIAALALSAGPVSAKSSHQEAEHTQGTHAEPGDDHGHSATEVEVHKGKGRGGKSGNRADDLLKGHKSGRSR